MRASERLFEANFCAEIARREAPNRVFWFAPTQQQEAQLAFDLMTAHAGGFSVFQMKAPARELAPRVDGAGVHHRRLRLELAHAQLVQLRANFGHLPNTAFYAFPAVMTVADYLQPGFDLLQRTFRFDVSMVPAAFPAPIAHGKVTPRQSGKHLGDFDPDLGSLVLHSEPFEVSLESFGGIRPLASVDPFPSAGQLSRDEFVDRLLSVRGVLLAVLAPPPNQ